MELLSEEQLNILLEILTDEEQKLSRRLKDDPETAHEDAIKLTEIKKAISRWHEGSYGYCADCEEDIHFARLKNCPELTHCARCS